MGIKLEWFLAFVIAGLLLFVSNIKLSDTHASSKMLSKEMEFTQTTFTEVTTQKPISTAFAQYGIREGGILKIKNLVYETETIERLLADEGCYEKSKVYLDGHIRVIQKEGFSYDAKHAIYDKETEVLTLTSAFTAKMNQNRIEGAFARYDTRKKILLAKEVHAVLYTVENKVQK